MENDFLDFNMSENNTQLKELIKEVLDKGYLMSLGVSDEHGIWVSDVIYIYDDNLNIFWMSDPDIRHSKAIQKNSRVAGTITVWNKPGEDNLGIQFEGIAEKIEGPRSDLAMKHYGKRGKEVPKEVDEELHGNSWYVLKPNRIDLICEKLFGFKKQRIEL